jgi:CubicO group peptidase (beta-lactamase class C family)
MDTEWRGMMRLRFIVLAALFWLFQIGLSAQETPSAAATRIGVKTAADFSSHLAAIDAMAANQFAKHPIGSITIGVVSGNALIWTKSYGHADEKKVADKETVYRIGSVTKMFTALMFEQLVEAGTVHLTDPVEKYFPEVNSIQDRFGYSPAITLFQLATHTSGLGSEPDDLAVYVRGPVSAWERTLIASLPHVHYRSEPGTQFLYSNVGYAILGAALSHATQQPYTAYVPEHIFVPLGMTHSYLELPSSALPHLSKGYELDGGRVYTDTPKREHAGRGYKVPNGAAYTTLEDLAHFESFLMGFGPKSVLKASSLEHFLTETNVASNIMLSDGYGLGGVVVKRPTYTAVGHDGDVAGYEAALYMNRGAGIGVIVLANSTGDEALDSGGFALDVLDILSK